MDIWYIVWTFGIFPPFWYVVPEKSGNPAAKARFLVSEEKLRSVGSINVDFDPLITLQCVVILPTIFTTTRQIKKGRERKRERMKDRDRERGELWRIKQ
jgi:hypothetical protein